MKESKIRKSKAISMSALKSELSEQLKKIQFKTFYDKEGGTLQFARVPDNAGEALKKNNVEHVKLSIGSSKPVKPRKSIKTKVNVTPNIYYTYEEHFKGSKYLQFWYEDKAVNFIAAIFSELIVSKKIVDGEAVGDEENYEVIPNYIFSDAANSALTFIDSPETYIVGGDKEIQYCKELVTFIAEMDLYKRKMIWERAEN